MIRDEDLKSSVDYSEGQKRAAHRVLVELVNVFQEYEDEIRVVGGWVPDLMFPEDFGRKRCNRLSFSSWRKNNV